MMATAMANGIRIEYETFGEPSSPALLLIIGLAGQLIEWHEDFCKQIAAQGYYVIRFDNRDVGLSQKFDHLGIPDIMKAVDAYLHGEIITAPYTIEDMAADAVGLLDALGIQKAHICGMSMGGMIAQAVAIRYPARILSLISIYSTTGNPALPPPEPKAMQALIEVPPIHREAYIEYLVRTFRIIAGSGFPFDEQFHRQLAEKAYDRSFYPQGSARQLMAVITQKNRKPALASVTVPTPVIHGTDDPLVPMECGKDTAVAIPGAALLLIEGMGHDLPPGGAWLQILDAIVAHMKRATAN